MNKEIIKGFIFVLLGWAIITIPLMLLENNIVIKILMNSNIDGFFIGLFVPLISIQIGVMFLGYGFSISNKKKFNPKDWRLFHLFDWNDEE